MGYGMTRRAFAALAACATFTFGGAAYAQDTEWAKIEEAAKKAGVVSVYHNLPPPGGELFFSEISRAYPEMRVEMVRLSSAALIQRLDTEYRAGNLSADIVGIVWDDVLKEWLAEGRIKTWSPPEAAAYPPQYNVGDGIYTMMLNRDVIVYNTMLVSEDAAPKEWKDLLGEAWKGKVAVNPPWRSTSMQGTLAFLEEEADMTAENLKANDFKFFEGSAGVFQAVIRGDIHAGLGADPSAIAAMKDGAPIGLVYPASGVPTTPSVLFVPSTAPHPEAGMLALNWALSVDGQETVQRILGSPGVRPGISKLEGVPSNEELNLIPKESILTPEIQKAMVDHYRTVFQVQ